MSTFELNTEPELGDAATGKAQKGLGNSVLLNNILWFARIRWFVILLFLLAGSLGLVIPGTISTLGFIPPATWPWIIAAILIAANSCFSFMSQRLDANSSRASIEANIWLQIVIDLVIVTAVVHIIGSTSTFISFIYLFHIALACIFFPLRSSLMVTILAAVMYLTCIAMEMAGILPPSCIFANPGDTHVAAGMLKVISAGSGVVIWFVIWYLVCHLSEFVRVRDIQLDILNKELLRTDQEKNRLMLQTTHDLKAPFAGIESNIQTLRLMHWNEMSEPVQNVLERIEVRSETLRERIKDILLLGELRANTATSPASCELVNLHSVITAAVEELSDKAEERKISVSVNIPAVNVSSNGKQLRILFLNLISNAILYSRSGGKVEISAKQQEGSICVSVTDYGIGIKPEALPHIFEEYFRTKAAAEFNRMSTGLGLAIVKQVALGLNLKIRVKSIEEKGTTFEVLIPAEKTV